MVMCRLVHTFIGNAFLILYSFNIPGCMYSLYFMTLRWGKIYTQSLHRVSYFSQWNDSSFCTMYQTKTDRCTEYTLENTLTPPPPPPPLLMARKFIHVEVYSRITRITKQCSMSVRVSVCKRAFILSSDSLKSAHLFIISIGEHLIFYLHKWVSLDFLAQHTFYIVPILELVRRIYCGNSTHSDKRLYKITNE